MWPRRVRSSVLAGTGPVRRALSAGRIDTLAAFLVVVCSLGSFAYRVAVAGRSTTEGIGSWLTIYARVSSELPPGERVGFVSLIADPTTSGAATYAAQNALAPRILEPDFAAVSFVITTPDAPEAVDNDPRLIGFDFVRTSAEGVRIYRRHQ